MKRNLSKISIAFCVVFIIFGCITSIASERAIQSKNQVYINGVEIPAIKYTNKTYVLLKDLRSYGFKVLYDDASREAYIEYSGEAAVGVQIPEKNDLVTKFYGTPENTDIIVMYEGENVDAINVNSNMAVNLNFFHTHADITVEDGVLRINFKEDNRLTQKPTELHIAKKQAWFEADGNKIFNLYQDAKPFYDDLAAVKIDDKWGFIDSKGHIVIDNKFDAVKSFAQGVAPVAVYKGTNLCWGIIDKKGHYILEPKYSDIKEASSSRLAYQTGGMQGKWGYLDLSGNMVVSPSYSIANNFSGSYARVKQSDGYIFIGKTGNALFNKSFQFAQDFIGGWALVSDESTGTESYVIDTYGNAVMNRFSLVQNYQNTNPRKMTDVVSFANGFEKNIGVMKIDKGNDVSYVFINKAMQQIGNDSYQEIRPFNNGYAAVKVGNKWWMVDSMGSLFVEPIYDYIDDYNKDALWGIIYEDEKVYRKID